MGAGELPLDFEYEQSGKVIVAPERFQSDQEIIDTCNQLVIADRRRIPWRASIDGLFQGNPTYRLKWLQAKGQGWRARVNYRGLEGLIQARQTPFYDLVSEVDPCIEVCLDYGKGVDAQDWQNKIAKNFSWMLMKLWRRGFNYHIPLQQLEMLKHGIGYHIWAGNKNCWIPDTPLTGMVLFPDNVPLNIDEKLDYFMLRDFVPGFWLYQRIQNEKAARGLGWNPDAVWSALVQSSKTNYRGAGSDRYTIEMAQREYKNGDIGVSNGRQSGVWLNHLFVKEIKTDKISQYTVVEGISVEKLRGRSKTDPFANCLFRKRDRFDKWPIVLLPYDIGSDGMIHSVRGLGARTKDFFELSNRLKNAMADQVLVGSTLNLKQTGDVDPDKMRLLRLGVMSIIPRGLEAMAGLQFPPLADGPIAFDQLLDRTLSQNNESYMQGTPEPVDRETAKSFSMRTQNSGQVAKGVHSLYASNYQQLLEYMFRIAITPVAAQGNSYSAQLAKKFQDKCLRDKVPPEAFNHIYEVNEVLSTGAGSAAARIDALMTIMKIIYPTTSEPKKINIERDLVATLVTSSKVDRYAREHDENQSPDQEVSFATLENDAMMQGGKAVAASTQDQVAHLQTHLAQAEQVAQLVMQGQMPPDQGLGVIRKFGEHCAQHLQFLQQNPMRQAEFTALHKEWLALSVIADKLQQQVEAMQASQARGGQPQEKISDDLKIGLAKVAVGERLGQAKIASKTRLDLTQIGINGRIKAMETQLNGATKAA